MNSLVAVSSAQTYRPAAALAGFYNKMPFDYLHEQLSLCLAHEALCKMFLIKVIALKIVLYKICCKDL